MTENEMMSTSSLQVWYDALRNGQDVAINKLWQLYFQRMVHVARRKLDGSNRVVRDEEDVALSAFKSFCIGFRQGRFSADTVQDNLWPLLVTLTINKSIDYIRLQNRAKRGGAVRNNSTSHLKTSVVTLDEIVANSPSPELQVALDDSFQKLLVMLDATNDPTLRQIALLTIEGEDPARIASILDDCSVRTIQRKLKTIRAIWETSVHESQ